MLDCCLLGGALPMLDCYLPAGNLLMLDDYLSGGALDCYLYGDAFPLDCCLDGDSLDLLREDFLGDLAISPTSC